MTALFFEEKLFSYGALYSKFRRVTRLGKLGAKLVGEVVQYENIYRLCYIRGPKGILSGLAQQLKQQTSRANPMKRRKK